MYVVLCTQHILVSFRPYSIAYERMLRYGLDGKVFGNIGGIRKWARVNKISNTDACLKFKSQNIYVYVKLLERGTMGTKI